MTVGNIFNTEYYEHQIYTIYTINIGGVGNNKGPNA